jgi:small subunit ribosomal protein S17
MPAKKKEAVLDVVDQVVDKAKSAVKQVAEVVSEIAESKPVEDAKPSLEVGEVSLDDVQRHVEGRGFRKTRSGYVVSDKMDKTVVVAVEDRVKHPLYGKVMRRTSKLKAHDDLNECGIGDRVLLMETRPLSATKRWRVLRILEKAE